MFINPIQLCKVFSRLLLILSCGFIISIIVGLLYNEDISAFVISFAITFITGSLLYQFKEKSENFRSKEIRSSYFTVTTSWLLMSLAGSLPYLISGSIPGFTNAFFESASGFTTTGSSILSDIEALPKSILFWRSLTHWIGGIGIIVLVIIIMPSLKTGGYHLFTLESSFHEKIKPKIKSVARRIFYIYLLLTLAQTVLLMAGDMNLYESLCHSFGTVATGGFSPKNDSLAGYSPYIQYVVMIFMILAGTNFIIHYYILKREFTKVRQNDEFWFYLFVIGLIGLIVSSALYFSMNKNMEQSFREGFFQVISIITCTGFATTDYLQWPVFAWVTIFFSMFLGGCTGSTAGGIKMVRHLVLLKNVKRMFLQETSPHGVFAVKINNKKLTDEFNSKILAFITTYLMIFAFGSLLLIFIGIGPQTATSAVATCMAGIGPGIGSVGPAGNFAHLPDMAKTLLSLLMIMGRLEIYTVLILFSGKFWRV
jgi:trk system potassium uptake protein TrkH